MAGRADTVVVDLDGTLADVSHRLSYVRSRPPDWPAFFARVSNDRLNAWCRDLIRALTPAYRIVIVSGRPMSTFDDTRAWLERNHVPYDDLVLVRAINDHSPDQELKRAWLRSYGKERILFTVDDRQKVVNMWREEGVVCLQCAAWEEPDKTKP